MLRANRRLLNVTRRLVERLSKDLPQARDPKPSKSCVSMKGSMPSGQLQRQARSEGFAVVYDSRGVGTSGAPSVANHPATST